MEKENNDVEKNREPEFQIYEYLDIVSSKVKRAIEKRDYAEISRLLRLCSEVCIDKAVEIEDFSEHNG